MTIYIKGHRFAYEMENVARGFLREVTVKEGTPDEKTEYIFLRRTRHGDGFRLLCLVKTYWFKAFKDCVLGSDATDKDCERELSCLMYDLLTLTVAQAPPWGVLTGVRPAKFAAGLLTEGLSPAQVGRRLSTQYRVLHSKAALAVETAQNGLRLAQCNTPASYSLYVSIPFCPTRCSYCSFVSKTVDRDKQLVDRYLDRLCDELAETGAMARQQHLKLETVYVGGGTPTTLTEKQLERLTQAIDRHFPLADAREYTVEAGRPDTITPQKLAVLKGAGVGRISINPQSASDHVLRGIGRMHTAADIEAAFVAARAAGFGVINADLIAGLPRDDLRGFSETLVWLFGLAPENITLHALTVKRSSYINEFGHPPARDARAMLDSATDAFRGRGYLPYYLYRQKGTVEGLENTGWAKPGTECLYNVFMMDERHTILSCGAGAVTKFVHPYTGDIERVYNYKYPAEYIRGFETLCRRKERITQLYESCF
jgi:oxygen-independent coproporphyrinogen-3 oxidase